MKKTTILQATLYGFLLVACSKPESEDSITMDQTPIVTPLQKTFEIKQLDEVINNFKIGQRLRYSVEIPEKLENNTLYYLKPTGRDEDAHQVLGRDYILEEEISTGKFVTRDSIGIKPKGKFYITVKQPGTFKLNFTLQKYDLNTKKYIEKALNTNKQTIFNAVSFYMNTITEDKGKWAYNFLEKHTKINRFYNFLINDGQKKNDTYLEDSFTYTCTYRGQVYTGIGKSNTMTYYCNPLEMVWIFDAPKEQGSMQLKITQKLPNGETNHIDYGSIDLNENIYR